MILTKAAIAAAVAAGEIRIEPFEAGRLSANAYDWRLGETLRICDGDLDAARPTEFTETTIPAAGIVLQPGLLYLGVTHEKTGSETYAQFLNGNRTTGSLGIWTHVSAPLGHVGHAIAWTLEIRAARPVRVYPRMTLGKLIFLATSGDRASYQKTGGKYAASKGIDISRLYTEITGATP
ncbi:deoxycytidine triphosphate deaminase [Streptomyces olivoreticuli]|uniref:dCTP deaminase n=1 Tax=Streptomyces olivoreticuli TaxID=68246 RepID=UPI00265AC07E|nr:deoxycytidine triphosphate deaminase [Streptomyces olivoreticuli]WKK21910.1 deoxycytidine triphosphate deaminase [Streptomyces olivoreticuli]WKK26934.1 deoxycytidine triphosphate deaminase [Streptomyces olivoreticuli]